MICYDVNEFKFEFLNQFNFKCFVEKIIYKRNEINKNIKKYVKIKKV